MSFLRLAWLGVGAEHRPPRPEVATATARTCRSRRARLRSSRTSRSSGCFRGTGVATASSARRRAPPRCARPPTSLQTIPWALARQGQCLSRLSLSLCSERCETWKKRLGPETRVCAVVRPPICLRCPASCQHSTILEDNQFLFSTKTPRQATRPRGRARARLTCAVAAGQSRISSG